MQKNYTTKLSLLILFMMSISFFSKAQYCMPTYSNYCIGPGLADYIDNFSTSGGITNITNNGTGCNGSAPNNYTYLSTMNVSQVQGLSFNVSTAKSPVPVATSRINFGLLSASNLMAFLRQRISMPRLRK